MKPCDPRLRMDTIGMLTHIYLCLCGYKPTKTFLKERSSTITVDICWWLIGHKYGLTHRFPMAVATAHETTTDTAPIAIKRVMALT